MYLDDMILFSKSFEDLLRHVKEILSVLRNDGLSLKLLKCQFFRDIADYHGHVIRPWKLQVSTKKTEAVA